MKKRILSILLALTLCVTLLPTAVFAESSEGGAAVTYLWQESGTVYSGANADKSGGTALTIEGGLYKLLSGSYQLLSNITLDHSVQVGSGASVTLYLNDCTLTGPSSSDAIVVDGGNLRLYDETDQLGALVSGGASAHAIKVSNHGSVILEGCVVCEAYGDGEKASALHAESGATVTMACRYVDSITLKKETVDPNAVTLYAHGGEVTGAVQNIGGTITRKAGVTTMTVFSGAVENCGKIEWGAYKGTVTNGTEAHGNGYILGGTFYGMVRNPRLYSEVNTGSSSIVNNGFMLFDSEITFSAETLNMSGIGCVQAGTTLYSNHFEPLNSYTSLLSYEVIGGSAPTGCTWNAAEKALTLNNVCIGKLDLSSMPTTDDIWIYIDGSATVNYIEAPYGFTGTITLSGKNAGTDTLSGTGKIDLNTGGLTINNLQMEHGQIDQASGEAAIRLNNSTVILNNGLFYADNFGSARPDEYGLVLNNSSLTVKKGDGIAEPSYEYLFASKIVLDELSTLELKDVTIFNYGNPRDGLDGLDSLEDFLPLDGEYTIQTYAASDHQFPITVWDVSKNAPATNLTLQYRPRVPYTVEATKGGTVTPPATTFTLDVAPQGEAGMAGYATPSGNTVSIAGDAVYTAGKTSVDGTLSFTGTLEQVMNTLGSCVVKQIKQADWTYENYDNEIYYVVREDVPADGGTDELDAPEGEAVPPDEGGTVRKLNVYHAVLEADSNEYYAGALIADGKMKFTCTYTGNGGDGRDDDDDDTYYTIKASAGQGGSISPSGMVSIRQGGGRTFTATPAEGYEVSKLLVDGKNVGAVTSYTFTNVYASHTVEAVFAAKNSNVPSGLNSTDHVAYAQGFADGLFHPNANITRAQTAVMLYRLLTAERRVEIETDVHNFSDVTSADWYSHEVATMANGGYINGYADGTFGGGDSITRAQFVAILVRFLGLRDVDCDFTDVPKTHWAYAYIATAVDAGWISGFDDGSFRPDQPITRAQVITIINRALNRGVDANSRLLNCKNFPDNPETAWHYYEILEAANGHDYTGKRPSENWTALR